MKIQAKITPAEKATNRHKTARYETCNAKGIVENGVIMAIRSVYFKGKINNVVSCDFILND